MARLPPLAGLPVVVLLAIFAAAWLLFGAPVATSSAQEPLGDLPPLTAVSISDASVVEGGSGAAATFTLSLSTKSPWEVSVDFGTAERQAAEAKATPGSDYIARRGETVTFAPWETTKTVAVDVMDDPLDEFEESFRGELSKPSGAYIADGDGTATIIDDDDEPGITIGDAMLDEGAGNGEFSVSLLSPSGRAVSVAWATSDDDARAPADYGGANGTLTFAPGETTATIPVGVVDDALDEPNEAFKVALSAAVHASLEPGEGVGTIIDDDPEPTVAVDDVEVQEGDRGTVDATFTVSLSAPSGRGVALRYETRDQTARSSADYLAESGELSFAAGATTRSVSVKVTGDTVDEPDETFEFRLSELQNARVGGDDPIATILDDDLPKAAKDPLRGDTATETGDMPAAPGGTSAAKAPGGQTRNCRNRRGGGCLLRGRCTNSRMGTNRSERLRGTRYGDRLSAGGGDDSVSGLGAEDCLDGGSGADRVSGGTASDSLAGGSGRDRLSGDSGPDALSGGSGADRLIGGGGLDYLAGGGGPDSLSGGRKRDLFSGGPGNDSIDSADGVAEFVSCGGGRDTARVDRADQVHGCERVIRSRARGI